MDYYTCNSESHLSYQSSKHLKLFLISGIFSIPSDINNTNDILSTKAHCHLEDSYISDALHHSHTDCLPQYMILSGNIKLYIQYISKNVDSSIKQYFQPLSFCNYLAIPYNMKSYMLPTPHVSVADIYFHLLAKELIYYNIILIASI